jgi:hypothetical protein
MSSRDETIEAKYVSDMKRQIDLFKSESITLQQLVDNLRGLFDATGAYRDPLRSEFEDAWSRICYESELRNELWAPSDWIKQSSLDDSLNNFDEWLNGLASD